MTSTVFALDLYAGWKFRKMRNVVGKRANRQVFPQLFQVLPNFHKSFYKLIEAGRTYFLFLLEISTMIKREKTYIYFDHISLKLILFALAISTSTAHACSVCFCQFTET